MVTWIILKLLPQQTALTCYWLENATGTCIGVSCEKFHCCGGLEDLNRPFREEKKPLVGFLG